MLSYLADYEDIFGPLRLFRFLTFRMIMAGTTAMLIGWAIGPWVIARLQDLKFAQSQRTATEVGQLAELHAFKKGTPSMGGLIICAAVTISTLLWAAPNRYIFTALVVYLGLTAIGFLDDFLKISKKNSRGLPGKYKLASQAVLTLIAMIILLGNTETHLEMSQLWVPFIKDPLTLFMPLWFIPVFFFFVMAGSSNAINLTDGVDGLAIGCTVTSSLAFGIMAYCSGNFIVSDYLLISYIPDSGELAVVSAALVGGGLAFLWYNSHPATVFMGDTGSLALGGLIGTIAFMIHQPLTLIIVGGIFVMEAVSVILQVGSYKLTKRRIFRMAPIHHHFELGGWHESKVVIRFWILSLLFAMSGLATLKLR